ncbi:sigma-70 family RNA polymerase sigma factor [Nitrospirillum viridazoti]|nr:sigma-70 family RNA polymerase sigma factor [Nitrospirillum amazonense]TWB42249.1 RNA polymerase ECF family sigma subunit [Nitrospirillum amazonense]
MGNDAVAASCHPNPGDGGGMTPRDLAAGGALDALIRQVAGGDRVALRHLYERESPRLYGLALRIVRRPDAAADAVQDAFVQIWRNAASFSPAMGSGGGWMASIVRYRALDMARRLGRETLTDAIPDSIDESPSPLEHLETARDAVRLRRCLERLDDKGRRAITLAFINGLSHAQVAEHLAIPLGTVKSWIRRGLASLKECLAA